MIYSDWMSYLKDSVRLRDIVMPGSHNAGSYGMPSTACCQDGDLREQFEHGVRHFCIRMCDDNKTGDVVMSHGIAKGVSLGNALFELGEAMNEHPTEFCILDIREYQTQKIGPVTLRYHADEKRVDELLEKHLGASKYALTDFDNIGDVTMGDIRQSGKRLLLINYREAYKFSVKCPTINPWTSKRHGKRAYEFVTEATEFFDTNDTSGIYWFQTQQTPNLGTDIGFVFPRKLDRHLRWHFQAMINTVVNTPSYLEKVNVISGDFMTKDYFKSREILKLNLLKQNISDEKREQFATGLTL